MTITRAAMLAGPAVVLAAMVGASVMTSAHADPLPYGPDTCINGLVWREARSGDTVCVTPEVRSQVTQQNADPSLNKDPNGAYGPDSCAQGFVWRQAFDGDTICVTPDFRSTMLAANATAGSNKQANQTQPSPSPTPIPSPAPAQPNTVVYEIYANRPGVLVDEVDIDTTGQKFGKTQLPFSQTGVLPSPTPRLRLRAYGYGSDRIGCRITVNGRQVANVMNGPVAICDV